MALPPGRVAAAIFPWPVSAWAEWGGGLLRAWRPDWDSERPRSSNPPSWFMSPEQTFIETIFWNLVFWGVAIALARGPGVKPLGLPRAGSRRVVTPTPIPLPPPPHTHTHTHTHTHPYPHTHTHTQTNTHTHTQTHTRTQTYSEGS